MAVSMLSEEVRNRRLGDLAAVTVGHVGPMASEYISTGIPFLRSQDVKRFRLDLAGVKYITPEFHERLRKSSLRAGDVVVVRTGTPGVAAVVPDDITPANCADLVIIRPGAQIDSRFLAYFINGAAQGFVRSRVVGAVQQHFNIGSARELEIPDFSLAEQRAIGRILGSFDDKIEANERIMATASELMDARFAEATLDAPTVPASRLVEPVLGGTPARANPAYWNGAIPWAAAKDVAASRHGVVFDVADSISDAGLAESPAKVVPAGTTLITARGTVGRVARASVEMSFNQTCYALLPNRSLPPLFVYLSIRQGVQTLAGLTHGTVFATITKQTFDILQLTVPHPHRWDTLLEELSRYDQNVIARLGESNALSRLRDALLPGLLSGRLSVTATAERGVAS